MSKIMIWPDIYREQGHWLPAINLAKSLQERSHQVEFMGIPDCEGVVSPYGATFHPILASIYPVGHTVSDKLEPIGQKWKPHHLMPMARGELTDLMAARTPDLLVVGYFAALEALILFHRHGLPFVILTTYLRHPAEDPETFVRSKLLHMSEQLMDKIMTTSSQDPTMTLDRFVEPLVNVQEMLPCAREFDFYDEDWEHRVGTHYVEPMILREELSAGAPGVVPDVIHPIPTDKKLIFATAGSQVADYEDKAKLFFQAMIDMMKTEGLSDYHLVLSVGDKLLQFFLVQYGVDESTGSNDLPNNVSLAAWVSQLDILEAAEIVFMHGGLATIKESISEGVPMVIIPLGKDQTDNALRIVRGSLGVLPESEELSPQNLRKVMTEVTGSKWIRQKVAAMQSIFAALDAENPPRSVGVIEGVLSV